MCKLIEASRWVSEGGSLSILIDQNTELAQNLDLIANSSFPDSRNLTLAGGTIFKVWGLLCFIEYYTILTRDRIKIVSHELIWMARVVDLWKPYNLRVLFILTQWTSQLMSFMTLRMHSPLLLPPKDSMTSIPVWGMGNITKPFDVTWKDGSVLRICTKRVYSSWVYFYFLLLFLLPLKNSMCPL